MAIACRSLYEMWADSLGSTYGSGKLESKFIAATNMALDDLSYDADLATNLTHIDSVDDDISDMDASYTHTMYTGLSYFAALLGVRPSDPKIATLVFNNNAQNWDRLKAQYSRSKDNANQPTQSNSMLNIGYLDDTDE